MLTSEVNSNGTAFRSGALAQRTKVIMVAIASNRIVRLLHTESIFIGRLVIYRVLSGSLNVFMLLRFN